ncbi:MAG: ImmA/IrrE family metallo-endopeptidase [Pseudomonadota bacterium]
MDDYAIQRPPVDPTEIAEEEDIEVVFATFSTKLADVSGFYDAEERAIYVNEAEHPNRQRFTLAHELGHHFLHREWAASSEYQVLLRSAPAYYDRHEVEANEFAGNLLMPKFLLDEFRHLPIPTMAKLFAVSVPAMKYRLQKAYGD